MTELKTGLGNNSKPTNDLKVGIQEKRRNDIEGGVHVRNAQLEVSLRFMEANPAMTLERINGFILEQLPRQVYVHVINQLGGDRSTTVFVYSTLAEYRI